MGHQSNPCYYTKTVESDVVYTAFLTQRQSHCHCMMRRRRKKCMLRCCFQKNQAPIFWQIGVNVLWRVASIRPQFSSICAHSVTAKRINQEMAADGGGGCTIPQSTFTNGIMQGEREHHSPKPHHPKSRRNEGGEHQSASITCTRIIFRLSSHLQWCASMAQRNQ